MIEFFIALFGGTYWLSRFSKEKSKQRQIDADRKAREEQTQELYEKYIATHQLYKDVQQYVMDNFESLVNDEFKTDLTYIYGSDFMELAASDVESFESRHHYHVVDALEFLVLAKKYNKLRGVYFKIGYKDEVPYSMRLFKKMNSYIKYYGARLSLVPKVVFSNPISYDWNPSGAKMVPLVTNTYSSYPESYAWEDKY